MVVKLYKNGRHRRIFWLVGPNGRALGEKYLNSLEKRDRAKFDGGPFRHLTEMPDLPTNDAIWKWEGDNIYCVKIFKHRLASFLFYQEKNVIITHGFTKKDDKMPPNEKERAVRLREWFYENEA